METLVDLFGTPAGRSVAEKAIYNYVKAVGKGLSKIMSKMGVSPT
jgi:glutamate synthase (NADPH/NADH) large chain